MEHCAAINKTELGLSIYFYSSNREQFQHTLLNEKNSGNRSEYNATISVIAQWVEKIIEETKNERKPFFLIIIEKHVLSEKP